MFGKTIICTAIAMSCFLLNISAIDASSGVLQRYIQAEDNAYQYTLKKEVSFSGGSLSVLHFISQNWRGIEWEHWLTIYLPDNPVHEDSAILIIEGGNNDPSPPSLNLDSSVESFIATQIHAPLAILQQVPNQPLMGGLREDALIAKTFDHYLESGEEDWPLLLPMAKSGVRAMDAVESFLQEKHNLDINSFIVGGGSKRGWTSYLVAAVDERVTGLVPVVIDMLNLSEHMERQLKSYGEYSEMITDYSELNIIERMKTEKGRQLEELVDPYSYRDLLNMPKLIILGTNDPYWVADAASLYFDDLPEPKSLHYGVGVGHDVDMKMIPTLMYFFNQTLEGLPMPVLDYEHNDDGNMKVSWDSESVLVSLFTAENSSRDFRNSTWRRQHLVPDGRQITVEVEEPEEGYLAYFVQVGFPDKRLSGTSIPMPPTLSTPIHILPREKFPYDR